MEEKENLEQEETLNKAQASEEEKGEGYEQGEEVSNNQEKSERSVEEKLTVENSELKEKYLRLYSEFENYRRRTAKERLELIKTASEEVISDLLPVLDDFERSIKAEEKELGEQAIEGRKLIYNKMVKVLTSKGLTPMEGLVGKEFDAEMHEAITQIPSPSEELKGKIVDVVEKGYLLGEKVIRYAKVVIGQ